MMPFTVMTFEVIIVVWWDVQLDHGSIADKTVRTDVFVALQSHCELESRHAARFTYR